MIHCVKCLTQYFDCLADGMKSFEIRRNDRNYKVGDYLAVNEIRINHEDATQQIFTGKCCMFEITYVLEDYTEAVKAGYVVLGIKKIELEHTSDIVRNTPISAYNRKE